MLILQSTGEQILNSRHEKFSVSPVLKCFTYVSKDGVVHCLQIKGTQIDITQTWETERPATTVMFSPDHETLLLSSDTVSTQMYQSEYT